MLQQLILVVIC